MEELTLIICDEFYNRAQQLPDLSNPLFVGSRRALAKELQLRCGISELWAFNIINGYHSRDYVSIIEFSGNGGDKKSNLEHIEYLKWLAEKEEKESMEQLMIQEEMSN